MHVLYYTLYIKNIRYAFAYPQKVSTRLHIENRRGLVLCHQELQKNIKKINDNPSTVFKGSALSVKGNHSRI